MKAAGRLGRGLAAGPVVADALRHGLREPSYDIAAERPASVRTDRTWKELANDDQPNPDG